MVATLIVTYYHPLIKAQHDKVVLNHPLTDKFSKIIISDAYTV